MQAIAQVGNAGLGIARDLNANRTGSAIENSMAYAPRAALVAPGVSPTTGAANVVTPTGAPNMAVTGLSAQNPNPVPFSTAGTAPAAYYGGREGLPFLQQQLKTYQSQGNQDLEDALTKAKTQYTTAQTAALGANQLIKTEAQRIAQQRADQQSPEAKAAALAQKQAQLDAEKNADTLPRLYKDLQNQTSKEEATTWQNAFAGNGLTRGKFVTDGGTTYFVSDPNGPVVSASDTLKKPPTNTRGGFFGIGGQPAYTESDAYPSAPYDAMAPFADRYQKIQAAGGRYVPPVVPPATTGQTTAPTAPNQPSTAAVAPDRDSAQPGQAYLAPDGTTRIKPQTLP